MQPIAWLVSRHVRTWQPPVAVVRFLAARARTYAPFLGKAERKALYRQGLAAHAANKSAWVGR